MYGEYLLYCKYFLGVSYFESNFSKFWELGNLEFRVGGVGGFCVLCFSFCGV